MTAEGLERLGVEPLLGRMAEDTDRLTASGMWKALRPDERALAARYVLEGKGKNRKALVSMIAVARRVRPETVRKWPDGRLAGEFKTAFSLEAKLVSSLLEQLHATGRRAMVGRFDDLLGANLRNGLPSSAAPIVAQEDELHAAADRLAGEYGVRNAVLYLLVLVLRRALDAGHLRSWTRGLANRAEAWDAVGTGGAGARPGRDQALASGAAQTSPPSPDATPAPPADPAQDQHDRADPAPPGSPASMTSLDRLLTQAILDTAQDMSGALSRDEVDRAVEEFVRLNGRRPLSHYHAGFRDTVFGQSTAAEDGPALDRDGQRFYWAGAIRGWARTASWPSIVREYDGRNVVRGLGDGSDLASAQAFGPTVRALADEGRMDELARFVQTPALSGRLDLYELLLDAAIGRLRVEDPVQARPVLDLLVKAAEAMEGDGASARTPVLLEARRRQAQCLRQLNEHQGAAAALQALLKLGPDARMRALVHADLGLVASGMGALWEVRLPVARDDLEMVVEKLSLGEDNFRKAVAEDVEEACHAHYCLGVLAIGRAAAGGTSALAEEQCGEAMEHLSRARSAFLGRRDRYGPMCPAADLYYGIAAIGTLSPEGLAQGPVVMTEGLKAGAKLPPYFVGPLVEAVGLADQADRRLVYDAVVRAEDDATLDIAARSKSVLEHCGSAVRALQERGRRDGRPSHLAAADLRAALHGHVAAADHESAAELLDELEGLAQARAGVSEFEALLSDPSRYEPAWSREEAAMALAHSHESQGRYAEATEVLRDYFHGYASLGTDAGLHDAQGILEKIKQFGIDPSTYKDMEDRYDALVAESAQAEAEDDQGPRPEVKVLIVGGNEVQARAEPQVLKRLHKTHPHVRIAFIHTGWGSNWQKPLEEFQRKLPVFDAVVIMRFMRTELGKRIRKACSSHPWRSCWGAGPTAQVQAVIRAAEAASPAGRPGR